MIFFDIDGTLIDHLSASAAASLIFFDRFPGAIPCTRSEFPAIWEGCLEKHFARFSRGEISLWEQRRARIREVFAAPDMPEDETDSRYRSFTREYEALTQAYSDVAACLEALTGQSLGIISNGPREQQVGKLQRAGLLQYFSVMVYSQDVGLAKPAPGVFLEACRQAGKSPENCTYIGDNAESDIVPSRALGMRGVHLSRTGNSPMNPPVISTLYNLVPALMR
ncbi:MAG TPA: HAD family hydrolase [Terriglobales bacterium]|nr:HAD family hydrolase [Terriglobales bacterium]